MTQYTAARTDRRSTDVTIPTKTHSANGHRGILWRQSCYKHTLSLFELGCSEIATLRQLKWSNCQTPTSCVALALATSSSIRFFIAGWGDVTWIEKPGSARNSQFR